jgi:GTPase SAR1 family protein
VNNVNAPSGGGRPVSAPKEFDTVQEPEQFEVYVRQFVAGKFPNRHLLIRGRDSTGKTTIVKKVLPHAPVIKGSPTYYGILKDVQEYRDKPFVIFDDLHPDQSLLRTVFKNLFDEPGKQVIRPLRDYSNMAVPLLDQIELKSAYIYITNAVTIDDLHMAALAARCRRVHYDPYPSVILDAYRQTGVESEHWDEEVYELLRRACEAEEVLQLDFRMIEDIVADKRNAEAMGWDWKARARERYTKPSDPRVIDDASQIMAWARERDRKGFSSGEFARSTLRFRGKKRDPEQGNRREAAFAYCVAQGWLRRESPPASLGKGRARADWYTVNGHSHSSQNSRRELVPLIEPEEAR